MNEKLTLSVEGMHCEACVRRVTAALHGIKGVEVGAVEVGSAQMIFNSDLANAEKIAAAINRIGFSAHIESK
jgi:copper chaperone